MGKNTTKIYNLIEQTKSILSKNDLSKCCVFTVLILCAEEDGDHVGCILMLPMLQWKEAHFK